MQAAQASDNVPARYEPARLRRPTTTLTGRGHLLGLEIDLGVTAAEPATEVISVAAGAPATVLATAPTDLHPSLRRLADGSRPPTPEGSQPGFPGGDVATPIRPITGRPSLAPSSCTRSPIGRPYDLPTLKGGLRAYHVAPPQHAWVRSRLDAGGSSSAPGEFGAPGPGHVPFGPSLSAPWACSS
jgi:hypothetical protein